MWERRTLAIYKLLLTVLFISQSLDFFPYSIERPLFYALISSLCKRHGNVSLLGFGGVFSVPYPDRDTVDAQYMIIGTKNCRRIGDLNADQIQIALDFSLLLEFL